MRKIIFLDMDGVIATPETVVGGVFAVTPRCQYNLGYIIDRIDVDIVLSSSWRKDSVEETRYFLKDRGFRFYDLVVGVTIRPYRYIKGIHLSIPRGVEIKQWIDTNIHSDNGKNYQRKEVGKDFDYVIIDDDSDMLLEQKDHFVKTDSRKGLTHKKALEVISILNRNTL